MLVQSRGLLGSELLQLGQRQLLAGCPAVETFETQHQPRAILHQVGPPPQQVAHWPQPGVIDMRLGQNVQSLQLRQMKRVVSVLNAGAMARKLRTQYPGVIYRVMNRGDRRRRGHLILRAASWVAVRAWIRRASAGSDRRFAPTFLR